MSQADTMQPKRSILALSLGISLSAFAAIVAAILFSGASADAGTWAINSSVGTFGWTSSATPWVCTATPCSGAYPGAGAGDGVNQTFCCNTFNVDAVVPNPVVLSLNAAGTILNIPGGTQ